MTNSLKSLKGLGRKLNYCEFKHINLKGPTERVIKLRKTTQDSEGQRRASESALKMLKT